MAFFKCKMCGGTVEFEQGATVGVCDSCGTKQTLPRLDDDKKANLYDRANHFRRNNEYDKAIGIYEHILSEDNTDPEAYWSLVLCRYGIEYVEDPATHKRVPTVNRAQYMSVSADEDYKSALKYANASQRPIYEQDAKTIDEIQKGILEISSKEEPFDIFISYKENDDSGRRTQDSVLANDLYHQLTNEGFKVFFSRITLEDKLGTAYEPYIFSALNSAKVMVVIGTKPEYFNAVWVKNEWSRYLALVKKSDGKKMLIPAYRDMDPYDLPEEFSHLQAQDMSKLGFMQDLIRGIKKIVQADEPKPAAKESAAVSGGSALVAPLLKRVFMFLEDANWKEANEYCEKVLDQDPENAQAYVGKVLAKLRLNNVLDINDHFIKLYGNKDFDRAIQFAVGQEKKQLSQIKEIADKKWFAKCFSVRVSKYQKQLMIDEKNKQREFDRKNDIYEKAVKRLNEATVSEDLEAARDAFKSIPGFKDADTLAAKAETDRKDAIYNYAAMLMQKNEKSCYSDAVEFLNEITDWKDAKEQIDICNKRIAEIEAEEEAEADARRIAAIKAAKKAENRRKARMTVTALFVCALICFIAALPTVIIPNYKYNAAMELYSAGKYSEAAAAFEAIIDYKDSEEKINTIERKVAENLFIAQKNNLADITVGDTVKFGSYEQDNNTENGKEEIRWEVLAVENEKALLISKYALVCRVYNSQYVDVTWESCTLRNWLNDTFLNDAFGTSHQKMILSSTVSADKNPKYETDPGNDTTDKVFLLSIDEAEKYFPTDEERKCVPTKYATANGANVSSEHTKYGVATCWWWLRSPGNYQNDAAGGDTDGSVHYRGGDVAGNGGCVRPAMWISLE